MMGSRKNQPSGGLVARDEIVKSLHCLLPHDTPAGKAGDAAAGRPRRELTKANGAPGTIPEKPISRLRGCTNSFDTAGGIDYVRDT